MVKTNNPLIFISAAEPSADRHAADLIRAVLRLDGSIRFMGIAGPRMMEAGCHGLFDLTRHAAMLLSAAGNVARGITALRLVEKCFTRFPFAASVLVDSPMLHLPMAAKARVHGVPVLYYIAPQLWAWGAHRIYKVRHRVDRLAVILPFEEAYFRDQGVDARFVGHPLAEQVDSHPIDARVVADLRRRGEPVVALLPGSRRHVVESVLPGQIAVAEAISQEFPRASFVVSAASRELSSIIETHVGRAHAAIQVHRNDYGELMEAADLVLVASGTAALEVAFHHRPMIVMYNASPVFYHLIGRWMLKTPYLSLPNIIAQRPIVPEFMPYYRSTAPITETAIQLLRSPGSRRAMTDNLRAAVEPLRTGRASQQTAQMLVEMIHAAHS